MNSVGEWLHLGLVGVSAFLLRRMEKLLDRFEALEKDVAILKAKVGLL